MKRSYRNTGQLLGGLSDQLPLNGIHHCFQAVVGAEFLVDVVKMITEGLRANPQGVGNIITILAFSEQAARHASLARIAREPVRHAKEPRRAS